MPKEGIPITPKMITWARLRAGFSIDEARRDFKNIEAWESGINFPTYPQLEQLAEKFKLPIAVFFFPEPPSTPPIQESFRTLPKREFDAIPRRVRFLLRQAKAFQINLFEINQGRNPSTRLITKDLEFEVKTPIPEMARRVREYLGVSIDTQYAWSSDIVALDSWRQIINDAGIFVFKDAFKVDDYAGLCLFDETFPIIYVNNSSSKTRQIFTLFHELAHLIFHTSGIDTLSDQYIPGLPDEARKIEVICNSFAAHFLVPESEFNDAFSGAMATEETAENLARKFHVSRETIFRRFLDRGLIDEIMYVGAAARWNSQRKKESGGGDYYNTQISYLGQRYIKLALSQYYQNRIDDIQLADYLNINARNLGKFEERFSGRSA